MQRFPCLFLLALGLPGLQALCSPAEVKCGNICCCVTCNCIGGDSDQPSCTDMWGDSADPMGTVDDERFSTPEWIARYHEEAMEEHRAFWSTRMENHGASENNEDLEPRHASLGMGDDADEVAEMHEAMKALHKRRRARDRHRAPGGGGEEPQEDEEDLEVDARLEEQLERLRTLGKGKASEEILGEMRKSRVRHLERLKQRRLAAKRKQSDELR